ncbi:MAG: glycosyl transferase [Bacillota bacterium]|nr:glycosyl transferase [Bacillota bacterium]
MNYGLFDNENREYVITNPKTPVKWINYIGGLSFGGFVDNTGGSLICKGDPALNRIIKYIPQMPDSDFKGETLYLRYKENGSYKIFSPFFVPTLDKYDKYECHVGLGYSRIISEFYGIRTDVLIFVPVGESRVIRKITVANLNDNTLNIDAIPVVEYTHFNALMQLTNADWVPQTMQSKLFEEADGLKLLAQYAFMNKELRLNFITSNYPVASFESDRSKFLGDNGYGTWKCPLSLLNDELSNYEALRGDNIGALMHHLGDIKKGESRTIITQLGQCTNIEADEVSIEKFRDVKNVDAAFDQLKKFWDEYLDTIVVDTPDAAMNTMLNIHNPRQCYITKNWSRYLSLYQLGFGSSRGIGFRDSSQDVMGVLAHIPEEGRVLIEKLLSVQKRNGSAMHQFNPLTMEGSVGDSAEMEDRPKYYSDDHLWIILAVCTYLKETGSFEFLSKDIPYYEKDKNDNPIETGTVLDHMKRAVEFTYKDVGAHGIPLLGFADWNDTVNLPTGAESMFTANLYGAAIKELINLLKYIGDTEKTGLYEQYYEEIRANVNKHAWDGEWYVRYFDYNGEPIGSNSNDKGKIYINAQTWSVMSGFADDKRAKIALESVNRMLNTRNGVKLSTPGYNGYVPEKGGITTYPPGAKENGGIFLHTNPWAMIAETIVGNGDRAFQYYTQINPVYKNDVLDQYECEPYVYPQNILGDEHPQFGLGRNSWLSGTSSWVYQAATKYILGVQADYDGLVINPCIPSNWNRFTMKRKFRNSTYEINIKKSAGVCKGVKSVQVDGKPLNGNKVPVFNDGKSHKVDVVM